MGEGELSAVIQDWLDRLRNGDESARQALISSASERLVRLARRMLREYPRLARWEQTDDVLQNALLRLDRALKGISPANPREFFALAALQVRRSLLDLTRHYYGPRGAGANVLPLGESSADSTPAESTHDPVRLAGWHEFHERVGALPEESRELFDLLWYQGLTQEQAAAILGVSERTVNSRWVAARLKLRDAFEGQLPV